MTDGLTYESVLRSLRDIKDEITLSIYFCMCETIYSSLFENQNFPLKKKKVDNSFYSYTELFYVQIS